MDVFRAFLATLQSTTITLNQKDMVNALNLLVQSTPSALWGEALHISGLFAHLLHKLIEGEVRCLTILSLIDTHSLLGVFPSAYGTYLLAVAHRHGRPTNVPSTDVCHRPGIEHD